MLYSKIYLYFFLFISTCSVAQGSFLFQNESVLPGTKQYFEIPIKTDKDSTFIPVTIFHGLKSGPVLGITAGIHGYEYPPILAGQHLNQEIDPQKLKGTIILVQIANVPAFLGRSPFLNPLDDKNLNRSFPGISNGSITERIAYIITNDVIARSDFFVDMHGGDAPEDLQPYNAWYQSDSFPQASQKGREMALAMGFDYAVIFEIAEDRLQKPSLYCSQEAFHREIPSVDIECGRLGVAGKAETTRITKGMFALFNHLKMIVSSETNISKKPIIIDKRSSIKSKSTGLFYSGKKAGDYVMEGEALGFITDFFGNKLEDIKASDSGVILYMTGTPPINTGETLISIGITD